MALARAWGLEAEVRARSVEVDWRMLESETLADAGRRPTRAGRALALLLGGGAAARGMAGRLRVPRRRRPHRVTPRGGTGLNIAMHDGYDLGWRLGWVLRGWAAPALLDGYEAERRPVAEYTPPPGRPIPPARGARPSARCAPTSAVGSRTCGWGSARRSTCWSPASRCSRRAESRAGTRWPPRPRTVSRSASGGSTRSPPGALGAPGGSALLVRSDGTPVDVLRAAGP
jgi:hypothetical protein